MVHAPHVIGWHRYWNGYRSEASEWPVRFDHSTIRPDLELETLAWDLRKLEDPSNFPMGCDPLDPLDPQRIRWILGAERDSDSDFDLETTWKDRGFFGIVLGNTKDFRQKSQKLELDSWTSWLMLPSMLDNQPEKHGKTSTSNMKSRVERRLEAAQVRDSEVQGTTASWLQWGSHGRGSV